ncbi:MAG: PAS domain S-box protein, partial [Ferruginibacter sp.]
ISSPRLLEIFGFKNPSTSHKDLLTCFHPVDKATRDAAIERSFIKGSLIYQARIIRHEDKMVCWIHVYGKIIYGENQKPLRMYGSVIDITRERTALEELKENESKFRLLSDSLSQQVWTTDDKGKFNYFNQAVYNFNGAGKDEKEKISWINTIHPDEKADNIKKWTSAIVNGQEFISEHRLRNVKGDYRWHISRAIPQYNELGVRQMWVGTSTDIQDQKNFSEELEKKVKDRTEKLFEKNTELKRSEERYYSMINEVQDYAIILLDKNGNIKHWNKGAEKIKGYSAEEIIGNNFKIFYTAEDLEIKLPDSLLEHAKEHGKSENQGWRVRKDGSRFWGNVVLTALHDDQRMVIGFSKVTRDLTDKKKAEENQLEYLKSIEQKNLELEHNNAELESFNYIASHDLQEPLRKIQAFSQLILEKEIGNLSLSGNDYFNRINDAASRMQNLIEALINYSQTNSSGVEMEETDLNVIISEVKHDLSNIIEEKKAVIESEELFKIVGNHVQLQQLFTNLISNAIKYCKPDKPPHLKITSKMMLGKLIDHTDIINEKKYLKISIEDNGIGFEQKYGTKIFELFQRLHSRTHYKGTGIGLAICKKIMRNHEGFIDAEGQPGIGSTFNLYFPANKSYQGGTISFK